MQSEFEFIPDALMYVEVTEDYRRPFVNSGCEFMINGNGYGKVIGTCQGKSVLSSKWTEQYYIEWADGTQTVMAKDHLQPSTRKKFFQARLSQ